jgi:GH15 family glucan-1,4-alpha-glucosidase
MADHEQRLGALPREVGPAIELTVEYLIRVWPLPCFDWWEEHDGHVHVTTLGGHSRWARCRDPVDLPP